jgi:hypothetical protein
MKKGVKVSENLTSGATQQTLRHQVLGVSLISYFNAVVIKVYIREIADRHGVQSCLFKLAVLSLYI